MSAKTASKKNPGGRPSITGRGATDTRVHLRVPGKQIELLQRAADKSGKTLSAWCREVLLREAVGNG